MVFDGQFNHRIIKFWFQFVFSDRGVVILNYYYYQGSLIRDIRDKGWKALSVVPNLLKE